MQSSSNRLQISKQLLKATGDEIAPWSHPSPPIPSHVISLTAILIAEHWSMDDTFTEQISTLWLGYIYAVAKKYD